MKILPFTWPERPDTQDDRDCQLGKCVWDCEGLSGFALTGPQSLKVAGKDNMSDLRSADPPKGCSGRNEQLVSQTGGK